MDVKLFMIPQGQFCKSKKKAIFKIVYYIFTLTHSRALFIDIYILYSTGLRERLMHFLKFLVYHPDTWYS